MIRVIKGSGERIIENGDGLVKRDPFWCAEE